MVPFVHKSIRFQKVVWSPLRNQQNTSGIIAAGCESGHLQLYSASKLLAGEDALVASQDKHTGNLYKNQSEMVEIE